MMSSSTFYFIVYLWIAIGLLSFPFIIKTVAPYGRHTSSKWGAMISNRWGWIIMAEVVVRPEYGLGGLISVSERRSQTEAIYAVIIVIVLIAVACDQVWRLGGELLFPYRKSK